MKYEMTNLENMYVYVRAKGLTDILSLKFGTVLASNHIIIAITMIKQATNSVKDIFFPVISVSIRTVFDSFS